MAFWFAVAQAKAGGASLSFFFFFSGSLWLLYFLLVVEVTVGSLPSFDQGFTFGTWPRCSFIFQTCAFCVVFARGVFSLMHVVFYDLQDWWVDQHGNHTWSVPPKLWHKAMRYTDWAQESLSGPVGAEDLLGHFVSCRHCFHSLWSVQCG